MDPVTGDLSDTRTRYLGSRPVKLFRVRMQGQEAVCNSNAYSESAHKYKYVHLQKIILFVLSVFMLVIILSQKYLCQTLSFKKTFVFFITDYKFID